MRFDFNRLGRQLGQHCRQKGPRMTRAPHFLLLNGRNLRCATIFAPFLAVSCLGKGKIGARNAKTLPERHKHLCPPKMFLRSCLYAERQPSCKSLIYRALQMRARQVALLLNSSANRLNCLWKLCVSASRVSLRRRFSGVTNGFCLASNPNRKHFGAKSKQK